MSEKQKECQECGWRGAVDELDAAGEEASGQTQFFVRIAAAWISKT